MLEAHVDRRITFDLSTMGIQREQTCPVERTVTEIQTKTTIVNRTRFKICRITKASLVQGTSLGHSEKFGISCWTGTKLECIFYFFFNIKSLTFSRDRLLVPRIPSLLIWTCNSWIMCGKPLDTARKSVYMLAMSGEKQIYFFSQP